MEQGIAIEAKLLEIQDHFFDTEEEKGFLDESEQASFTRQLTEVCSSLARIIVVKDMRTL